VGPQQPLQSVEAMHAADGRKVTMISLESPGGGPSKGGGEFGSVEGVRRDSVSWHASVPVSLQEETAHLVFIAPEEPLQNDFQAFQL